MNILIVEDEEQAAKKLARMLRKILPEAFFHGPLESVSATVNWLNNNPPPDLILLDIHLSDGLSFDIFEQADTKAPIIFTTAYDQYALRAFKLNSLDYLLKPVEEEAIYVALNKFKSHFLSSPAEKLGHNWHKTVRSDYGNPYKKRFVTKIGDRILAVSTEDVLFAFSEQKAVYLHTASGKNHLIDFSLDQLEILLDPNEFFRLNRKYTARYESIEQMIGYSNSRMKVKLHGCEDENIVLSRDKTRDFKNWLDA